MKKSILLCTIIFCSFNVQAQWYGKYGVNDIKDLNEEQLKFSLLKSEKNIKTGKILTFTGLGLGTVGLVLEVYAIGTWAADPIGSLEEEIMAVAVGEGLFLVGIGLTAAGMPLWIINANRKYKIEVALANFNSGSIYKQPAMLSFGRPKTIGLSLTVDF